MLKDLIPWRNKRKASSVQRYRQEDPFEVMHRQMNELFEDFFSDFGDLAMPGLQRFEQGRLSPRFEIQESDKELQIRAELPGMEEKDVEVLLDDNILTIRGEKHEEHKQKKKKVHYTERRYGRFERVLPLPEAVDREKVKASFKKGVLHIDIPKVGGIQPERKRIPINTD